MSATKKQLVGLADSDQNPRRARVDDITLTRGGDPQPLTSDQQERLKATGVRLYTKKED